MFLLDRGFLITNPHYYQIFKIRHIYQGMGGDA